MAPTVLRTGVGRSSSIQVTVTLSLPEEKLDIVSPCEQVITMKWMFYEGNALGFKGHKMTDKSTQWNKSSKLLIDLQGQWIQTINISAL